MKNIHKKADFLLGQESLIFFYKMLLIIIITVFIIIFVLAFFYQEYDVRHMESNILASKVAACYIESGEARLENFEKKPSERCGIYAGEDYYADIIFYQGFPNAKCKESLKGKWEQKDKCEEGYLDLRGLVSEQSDLTGRSENENWKCCVKKENIKEFYTYNGFIMEDGGSEQEDLRVLCDVFVNGQRPGGEYEKGCTKNLFHFILIYEDSRGIIRSPAIIKIKSGFKKRDI